MPLALRQVLAVLACTCGLIALAGQLNHVLAPFALTIEIGGLLVAFTGLRLDFRRAFIIALLTGLWVDASSPLVFGTHGFLYALAVCLLTQVRGRLPREETFVAVVAAMFVNLAFFVIAGFLALGDLPDPSSGALRLLVDLIASQLFAALIGPWFIALQLHSLRLAGASPASLVRRYA